MNPAWGHSAHNIIVGFVSGNMIGLHCPVSCTAIDMDTESRIMAFKT